MNLIISDNNKPSDNNKTSDNNKLSDNNKTSEKCHRCNKRVGLLGIKCKCDGIYCSLHRYSDKHDCKFDYKTHGKNILEKKTR